MASLQQQDNKDQQQNNNNNNKKVTIHAREDSDSELQNLFDLSLNKGGQRSLYVPLRMRNLPASFWQPPTLGSKSPSVHSRENSLDNSLGTFSPVPPGASPGGGVGTAHHNRANSCPATLEQTLAVAQQQNHNLQNLHLRQQSYDVGGGPDDLGPLPPGWEMAKAPNGQLYFMNHITKTTQWDDPRKQIQQQMVNQMNGTASPRSSVVSPVPNGQGGVEMGPLPSGWEQSVTADGEVYFIHHLTKKTTWYDPRIPMNIQQVPHKQSGPGGQESGLLQAQKLQQEKRLRRLENEKRALHQKQVTINHYLALKQDRENVLQAVTQTQEMMMRHSLSEPGTKLDPFNGLNNDQHNRQESTDSGLGMGSNFNLGVISEDVGMESMETDLDTTLTEASQGGGPATPQQQSAVVQQQQGVGAQQQLQAMEQPQQGVGAQQQQQRGQQGGGQQGGQQGGGQNMDTEELIPTLPELGEELSRDFMSTIFSTTTCVENELTWL